MIEVIRDPNNREVLLFTDDKLIAAKVRKAISVHGAVYSGPQTGFPWRVSKPTAMILLRTLGFLIGKNVSLNK